MPIVQIGFYNFGIKHVDLNNSTRLTWPSCLNPTRVTCQMHCFNPKIMELSTSLKSQKSILFMSEFWQFFALLCIFWISQSGIWTIQDQICFDLLGKRKINAKDCALVYKKRNEKRIFILNRTQKIDRIISGN